MAADRSSWEKETTRQIGEEKESHEFHRLKAVEKYDQDLQEWKEMHSECVLLDPKITITIKSKLC